MAVTSDTKLTIYNGALRRLGSRQLSSLSENREPRRVLDGIWGSDDSLVKYALERGEWNFALRAVQLEYSPSIETDFGFRRVFEKPDDYRRLASLSADSYFRVPLTADQYVDEAGFWLSDLDVIYVKYVSDHDSYGLNSAAWSEGFIHYLECCLAWEACERITNSTAKKDRLAVEMAEFLKVAKSNDTMGEGVKFRPAGSWVTSRYGAGRYRGER